MSSTNSAAFRVLDTAELLEKILLCLGEGTEDDGPVKQLFTLQRVDKTFRNSIQASSKLRRLMCLELEPTASDLGKRAPLRWLLRNLGHRFNTMDRYRAVINKFHVTRQLDGPVVDFYNKYDSLEASWHNIKISAQEIRFKVFYYAGPLREHSGGVAVQLNFEDGTTLGKAWEMYRENLILHQKRLERKVGGDFFWVEEARKKGRGRKK
ncbi:Hypothetical predicted protein [Lecanosticta acicola]|uniref:Uncharacterized protein n=1 Tax=Lecanosticta acicola TaxID=111012 RepID=A0AAI9EEH9_9PEZI|nr:Hypothetical predicted protein [Lecanosticta acicola]